MAIVITAVVFSGILPAPAFAEAPQAAVVRTGAAPAVGATPRGGRVLALLLTLEALRTAADAPSLR